MKLHQTDMEHFQLSNLVEAIASSQVPDFNVDFQSAGDQNTPLIDSTLFSPSSTTYSVDPT
jgi:hypothetical protein